LGCGDGVLGCALLCDHSAARGVFLDFSESMLAAARRRLGSQAHRHQLLLRDYGKIGWTDDLAAAGPFEAVVSGFSIHHQPDAKKRAMYRAVYGLLAPGGIFLNLEHVASASDWGERVFDDYFIDALWNHHRRHGRRQTRRRVARQYYHRADKAANRLSPVETQCCWLRAIGFDRVDCYFKALELALFGGVKPARVCGGR
jgi:ubiquinone/menaquinone biosynthesis C-methylase UbiE